MPTSARPGRGRFSYSVRSTRAKGLEVDDPVDGENDSQATSAGRARGGMQRGVVGAPAWIGVPAPLHTQWRRRVDEERAAPLPFVAMRDESPPHP